MMQTNPIDVLHQIHSKSFGFDSLIIIVQNYGNIQILSKLLKMLYYIVFLFEDSKVCHPCGTHLNSSCMLRFGFR